MVSTNSYITKLKNINLLSGLLTGEMSFQNGLNIISGENGTGKSKLLNQIKNGEKEFSNTTTSRIVIFNPKRNADKQNLEHFANKLQKQGLNSKKINESLRQQTFTDANFSPYPAFGELFMVGYEDKARNNTGTISYSDAIKNLAEEFNVILKQVFPSYEILASWVGGNPEINFKKNGSTVFPMEGLSCGESEVFSLIFNVYANRDSQDIYLIDEPEIHLNWSLEEGLFNFLDWFCNKYNKQIIVTTHSRMIFQDRFLKKSQFLIWKDAKIAIDNKISKEISDKIAGDSIKIISALELYQQTFFVEDEAHVKVITELAKATGKDFGVVKLGNCSAVQSFCKAAQKEKIQNALFLVDGDNQNPPQDLKDVSTFIHLKKYCIQNYFLDTFILSEISDPKNNETQIKQTIKDCIIFLNSDNKILVFKKLAEVAEIPNEVLDTFDASKIIESLATKIGLTNFETLAEKFIEKVKEKSTLNMIFDEILSKVN